MSDRGGRWQGPALVGATVLVLAGVWGIRTWSHAGEGGGWSMPPEAVGMVTAEARPWRTTSTLLATLAPEASVDVRAEVGGRLVEVGFESGQDVSRGTVLARLDTSIEEANLRALEANLRALTLRRDRTAELAAERGATRMDLDQLSADVDAATAQADALRAQIRQKTIVAPFAGKAGVRHHHPGQVIDPGVLLTSLVRAADAVFVDLWVPQTLLPSLPLGETITVRLDQTSAPATVEVIEPSADTSRRSVLVRARVSPTPPGWLPGMTAQVDVPTAEEAPRVVIPSTALVWSPVGELVYRVVPGPEGGEIVTANPVVVLTNLGDEIVLASGLDAGAKITTDGSFKLHEGAAVQPAPPPSAPQPAAPAPAEVSGEH